MSQPTPLQLQTLIASKKFEEGTTITGSTGTAVATGSVLFSDTSSALSHNANLFYDATNEYLGVGTRAPDAPVHIDQATTDAAVPCMHLDQADISEEFIEFTGQPDKDIMIQSLVGGGDATTFTVAGWARMNVVSVKPAHMSTGAYYVQLGTLT